MIAMYSEKVMDHFRNPRHAGEMEKASAVAEVGNPACGDVMRVQIRVEDGIIRDAKFLTFGCCAAIAASDAVCELVRGKTLDEALAMTKQDILDYLDALPKPKVHCSILGIDALKAAIKEYRDKNS